MRRSLRGTRNHRLRTAICFALFGDVPSWVVTEEVHTCYPNDPLISLVWTSSENI
jgi:hypothetical protein